MRDLLTNIKKAIEIINTSKKLTIHLADPQAVVSDEVPVGVSRREWEESIKYAISDLLFTADDINYNFDCSFNYTDLLIPDTAGTLYTDAMKRIIKAIYDQYKYFKNLGTVSLNSPQSITGSKVLSVNGGNLSWGNTLSMTQSAFSNLQVAGDLDVNGEIEADDIKVNGGQLSVSSELDDLKYKNQVLEAELNALKAMLESKGVI